MMPALMIDDLPDFVLVEILCRLFDSKLVLSCKLVSKRWHSLLSNPYFLDRFLRLRYDRQTPLVHALVLHAIVTYRNHETSLLTISPEFNLSEFFSLLPCFRDHIYPEVVGINNDLVLCSLTPHYQHDYYICNVYTKEWIHLPPSSRILDLVAVGLICEPYYSIKEDDTNIKLNPDYRFRVVRILPKWIGTPDFEIEIFSSETDEWKLYHLSEALSQRRVNFPTFSCIGPSVTCGGKLYWYHHDERFVFELDPFNIRATSTVGNGDDNVIETCRFIDAPGLDIYDSFCRHIGVCRGRLRMCLVSIHWSYSFAVWELNENQEWDLIFSQVNLSNMFSEDSFILEKAKTWRFMSTINFHPSDGDIVYFERDGYIVMCNLRDKTLQPAIKLPGVDRASIMSSYPYVFPWWPTPLQKIVKNRT